MTIARNNRPFGTHELFEFAYEHLGFTASAASTPAVPAVPEVAASLDPWITCGAKSVYVDGEELARVTDEYGDVTIFEADVVGDGVTAGSVQVNISTDTTDVEVAARLYTALAANIPWLTITDNFDATIGAVHNRPGLAGNDAITTENVTDGAHVVVSPFASGLDAVAGSAGSAGSASDLVHSATSAFKLFTAQRKIRVLKIELINPVGLTEHADNYWQIAIKAGATVVGQWSTATAAEGTLTADAVNNMTMSATDGNRILSVDDVISLGLTKVAAAADLPPGRLVIHGKYV